MISNNNNNVKTGNTYMHLNLSTPPKIRPTTFAKPRTVIRIDPDSLVKPRDIAISTRNHASKFPEINIEEA